MLHVLLEGAGEGRAGQGIRGIDSMPGELRLQEGAKRGIVGKVISGKGAYPF